MNKYTITAILMNVDDFYTVIFENCYVELALRYDLIERMSKEYVKLIILLSIFKSSFN